jgi:hypothetical protein
MNPESFTNLRVLGPAEHESVISRTPTVYVRTYGCAVCLEPGRLKRSILFNIQHSTVRPHMSVPREFKYSTPSPKTRGSFSCPTKHKTVIFKGPYRISLDFGNLRWLSPVLKLRKWHFQGGKRYSTRTRPGLYNQLSTMVFLTYLLKELSPS